MPRFSIVTPVYNPPAKALKACIKSVRKQNFADWEWCIVNDCSTKPHVRKILNKLAARDSRVRVAHRTANGGIVAASQNGLDMATGEFVALLDHDDVIEKRALKRVNEELKGDDTIDYVYTDEDKINSKGRHYDVFRKPDFDPVRLRGQNYCCHFSVFRNSLLDKIGGFREGFDGSQDFDLILRATEHARTVAHIPSILYHWRVVPGSAAGDVHAKPYAYDAGKKAVESHFARHKISITVEKLNPGSYQHRFGTTDQSEVPHVSIVIPTRGDTSRVWGAATCMVENTVQNIVDKSTYPSFDIVVVRDVNPDGSKVHPFTLPMARNVRSIDYAGQFNIAAKWNAGVLATRGQIVVVLDDDTQIDSADWLEQLVGQFQFPTTGIVGPQLLQVDGRIASAGISTSPRIRHIGNGDSSTKAGYMGMISVARTTVGVSGACMSFRRSLFDTIGGFSEHYQYDHADLDFCLKASLEGFRSVCTPEARVYHFGARTRGETTSPTDEKRFVNRWGRFIGTDPYAGKSA
jgi:glycosyltransferase involved in cell wall biosynthesis